MDATQRKRPGCNRGNPALVNVSWGALMVAFVLSDVARAAHPVATNAPVPIVLQAQRTPQSAGLVSGLHCFDRPYAPEKSLTRNEAPVARTGDEPGPGGDDSAENNGRMLFRDRQLPVPPEILRIRRGYVESFTGTFINDGLEHWDGVDFDRNLVIVVQRRIHDRRAVLSKPFDEPTFPPGYHAGIIFGRKFETEGRTEIEVVSVLPTDRADLEAFICVANGAWAAAPRPPPNITDGFIFGELLDEERRGEKILTYRKSVYSDALRAVVEHNLEQYVPQPIWN